MKKITEDKITGTDEEQKTLGRPTKYQAAYANQAYKLCLLGSTDEELADFFEVHVDTIYEWKKVYKTFSDAIKKGKQVADSQVADKLFKRATGYSHAAVKIFNDNGAPLTIPYVEHYPPDTAAAIFWLKNRQKDKWRDKHETDITTKGESIKALPAASNYTDEELEQLERAAAIVANTQGDKAGESQA